MNNTVVPKTYVLPLTHPGVTGQIMTCVRLDGTLAIASFQFDW